MICRRCGKENPDGAKFCGNCGAPLLLTPKQRGASPVALVFLIVGILAAAMAVAIFVIPRLVIRDPGPAVPTPTPAVVAGSSGEIEETPTPTPEAENPQIDAESGEAVEVSGTYIHVPGINGFLQLSSATTLTAPNEDGEIITRDNIYSIAVEPGEEVTDEVLEACNSKPVIISGPIVFDNKKEPRIEAQSITDQDGKPIEIP